MKYNFCFKNFSISNDGYFCKKFLIDLKRISLSDKLLIECRSICKCMMLMLYLDMKNLLLSYDFLFFLGDCCLKIRCRINVMNLIFWFEFFSLDYLWEFLIDIYVMKRKWKNLVLILDMKFILSSERFLCIENVSDRCFKEWWLYVRKKIKKCSESNCYFFIDLRLCVCCEKCRELLELICLEISLFLLSGLELYLIEKGVVNKSYEEKESYIEISLFFYFFLINDIEDVNSFEKYMII